MRYLLAVVGLGVVGLGEVAAQGYGETVCFNLTRPRARVCVSVFPRYGYAAEPFLPPVPFGDPYAGAGYPGGYGTGYPGGGLGLYGSPDGSFGLQAQFGGGGYPGGYYGGGLPLQGGYYSPSPFGAYQAPANFGSPACPTCPQNGQFGLGAGVLIERVRR